MPGSHEHDHQSREGLHIVVGYDGSPASRQALEQAAFDAGPLGSVYVVVAFQHTSGALGRPYANKSLREAQEHPRELIAELEHGVVDALQRTQWHPELLEGPAEDAILHVARTRGVDRIHLGTRGLGRARATLGSVAERVIEQADRPVLVFPERSLARDARHAPIPV